MAVSSTLSSALSMLLMIVWTAVILGRCNAQSPTQNSSQTDSSESQNRRVQERDVQANAALKRAIDWLSHAVPTWMNEHHCAACHHQGDAARALLKAIEVGALEEHSMLESTIDWCAQPDKWQQQIADPRSNDYRLADIQFSSTLLDVNRLIESGSLVPSRTANLTHAERLARHHNALEIAAEKLVRSQNKDGSWNIDNAGELASPITQGPVLLSGAASSVLSMSTNVAYRQASERTWQWLCAQRPQNVFEASSLLIALSRCSSSLTIGHTWPQETSAARQASRRLLLQVQANDSDVHELNGKQLGFGPYVHSSGENFDTAIAILAMLADDASVYGDRIDQAVSFLHNRQQQDGSWDETTRLSNVESYAHRTSTTAWVTQALLQVKQHRDAGKTKPRDSKP